MKKVFVWKRLANELLDVASASTYLAVKLRRFLVRSGENERLQPRDGFRVVFLDGTALVEKLHIHIHGHGAGGWRHHDSAAYIGQFESTKYRTPDKKQECWSRPCFLSGKACDLRHTSSISGKTPIETFLSMQISDRLSDERATFWIILRRCPLLPKCSTIFRRCGPGWTVPVLYHRPWLF